MHAGCALTNGMSKSLPPSPTPNNVAAAYAVRVEELADARAGRDGRLTAHEAATHPELADAHRRTGRSRPVVRTVVEVARAAMLVEASGVAGPDGRVSRTDATRMASPFAEAFVVMRDAPREPSDAATLVAELERKVVGLSFVSESDYRFDPFTVAVDPEQPLTHELLQAVLPWSEGPADQPEYVPPAMLRLEVTADDSFWLDEAEKDAYNAAAFRAVDRLMKRSFVEATVQRGSVGTTARIFSVTLPEEDAALAPYFVLGRIVSGEVVGVRTFRVWT